MPERLTPPPALPLTPLKTRRQVVVTERQAGGLVVEVSQCTAYGSVNIFRWTKATVQGGFHLTNQVIHKSRNLANHTPPHRVQRQFCDVNQLRACTLWAYVVEECGHLVTASQQDGGWVDA